MRIPSPETHLKTSLKAMLFAAALVAAPVFAKSAPPSPAAVQHCSRLDHHHHHGHHGWRHHRGMGMRGLHRLELSDAQKHSIHAAFKRSRENMRSKFKGLMQRRRAFETATPGTPAFNTAYGSYAQAAAAAAQARVKTEADLHTQVYSLLTDAQRAKLATLQAQHRHHHHHWHHHRQSSQS